MKIISHILSSEKIVLPKPILKSITENIFSQKITMMKSCKRGHKRKSETEEFVHYNEGKNAAHVELVLPTQPE